jgi:hypothetical protein
VTLLEYKKKTKGRDIMANKVTFDFSVAKKYVADSEVDMMKNATVAAKDQLGMD